MFEPVAVTTVDSINVTFNSVAVIVPPTFKSFWTSKSPWIEPEVFTTNPKLGETEAVTDPLAILFSLNAKADSGISNNPCPLPLYSDADTEPVTFNLPFKVEIVFTSNPLSGATDAVAEPLAILNDSSVSADNGISNNPAPLPLNTDADTEPLIWTEPLSSILTGPLLSSIINPLSGVIDAVAEPLNILDVSISEIAENGISNKSLPLPLNTEPLFNDTPPLTNNEELNSALSVPSNLNPYSGLTDAVTEPLAIKFVKSASGAKAERGMLNNPSPLPLKNPLSDGMESTPLTNVEPLICTLWIDGSNPSILNPYSGLTEAVIEPLAIKLASSAPGKLINLLPSPSINDADITDAVIFWVTSKLPLITTSPINVISAGLTNFSTVLIIPSILFG